MTDDRIRELWDAAEKASEWPDEIAPNFARAIEREVREECAKACEAKRMDDGDGQHAEWYKGFDICADAIRKGGGDD